MSRKSFLFLFAFFALALWFWKHPRETKSLDTSPTFASRENQSTNSKNLIIEASSPQRVPAQAAGRMPIKNLVGGARLTEVKNLQIQRNHKGFPFRAQFILPIHQSKGESLEEAALRTFAMSQAAAALGVDHPENLKSNSDQDTPMGRVISYLQFYDNYVVEGAQVRIFVDENNQIFQINNTFSPHLQGINTNPTVTQAEARAVALQDALRYDRSGRQPDINTANLMIYNFSAGGPALSWRITISQPWLGPAQGGSAYYVDARDKTHFERHITSID